MKELAFRLALVSALLWTNVHDTNADGKNISVFSVGGSMSGCAGGLFRITPEFLKTRGFTVQWDQRSFPAECLQGWLYWNRGEVPKWRLEWQNPNPEETRKNLQREAEKAKGFLDKALSVPRDLIGIQTWGDLFGEKAFEYEKTMNEWGELLKKTQPNAKIIFHIPQKFGDEKKSMVYPVAEKWGWTVLWAADAAKYMKQEKPDILLTRTVDDEHPNQTAMYMMSCMYFSLFTGESPIGLPEKLKVPSSYDFPPKGIIKDRPKVGELCEFVLPEGEAKLAQEAAWKTVQEEFARLEKLKEKKK